MSFEFHSLFLHAFINWYQVLGLHSHMAYSVYSSNRTQGDVCIYSVCVPYWNVIYILSCLYFFFCVCNPYNIATWTTRIYICITMCFHVLRNKWYIYYIYIYINIELLDGNQGHQKQCVHYVIVSCIHILHTVLRCWAMHILNHWIYCRNVQSEL